MYTKTLFSMLSLIAVVPTAIVNAAAAETIAEDEEDNPTSGWTIEMVKEEITTLVLDAGMPIEIAANLMRGYGPRDDEEEAKISEAIRLFHEERENESKALEGELNQLLQNIAVTVGVAGAQEKMEYLIAQLVASKEEAVAKILREAKSAGLESFIVVQEHDKAEYAAEQAKGTLGQTQAEEVAAAAGIKEKAAREKYRYLCLELRTQKLGKQFVQQLKKRSNEMYKAANDNQQ